MAYKEHTQYNSPNYTHYSQSAAVFGIARSIDGITYHWWGDPSFNPLFLNIISWLCRANGNTSAHVVGEAGQIAWIVDAINIAWHAGNARGNATTVGYECNPRLSDGDYQTMGEFHYTMEKAYNKRLAIYVHKEWSSTSCSPIDKARIRRIADSFHNGTASKKTATAAEVKQAYLDILERPVDAGGLKTYTTNGMSIAEVRADLMRSAERKTLEARKAAEYAKNEWVRNKKDITDVKLVVLPAAGIRAYDLTTGAAKGDVIPKGTSIDIVYETTVKGTKYYLSSTAVKSGQASGLKATELGVPAQPPAQEKPEWLKNLQDITDLDMWTRSETPVLKLTDGTETRRLPINTKVRISHATQIAGIKLLVLEGQTEAIEVVYLNDKLVENPYDDLDKRLSVLEQIVKAITDFLDKVFKWR